MAARVAFQSLFRSSTLASRNATRVGLNKSFLHNAPKSFSVQKRFMASKIYSEEHDWISVDGNVGTIGITDYAQAQVGDITYVEFECDGQEIEKGDLLGFIESSKACTDIPAPFSGTVLEINKDVIAAPETINNSPENDGWLLKMSVADPSELDDLMDEEKYRAFVKGISEE